MTSTEPGAASKIHRAQSASGNPFLGSTGHWPVPPGDSPGGTGTAPGTDKDWSFARGRLALPLGESRTGTGGSPVLPIFKTRSEILRPRIEHGWKRETGGGKDGA